MKLSPNRSSRNGWRPIAIVMHVTEGSGAGALEWLTNPEAKVSAHFLIFANGKVEQIVPLDEAAWHAGRVQTPQWANLIPGVNPNEYTIGIEHEGSATQTEWPDAQLRSSAKLIRALWRVFGPIEVIRHRQIYAAKTCPAGLPVEKIHELASGGL